MSCCVGFPITPQKQHPSKTTRQQPTQTSRHKWATFTYIGKETFCITNVFKHTGLKIAFRTNNTIENLLKQRDPIPDKFSSSGVYKLTCPDCHKAYVGQTGRQYIAVTPSKPDALLTYQHHKGTPPLQQYTCGGHQIQLRKNTRHNSRPL